VNLSQKVDAVCKDVAARHPGWIYTSSAFRNRDLKHTELIVDPGWTSLYGGRVAVPAVAIKNKKVQKLRSELFKRSPGWSFRLQYEFNEREKPLAGRVMGDHGDIHIVDFYSDILIDNDNNDRPWPANHYSLAPNSRTPSVSDYIEAILNEGIAVLGHYYDTTSEENLLRNLPFRNHNRISDWYEELNTTGQCIAQIILGNFDFVEWCCSDEFTTGYARNPNLDIIQAALPDLKRRYAADGSVV
jgi:hypothetical protein